MQINLLDLPLARVCVVPGLVRKVELRTVHAVGYTAGHAAVAPAAHKRQEDIASGTGEAEVYEIDMNIVAVGRIAPHYTGLFSKCGGNLTYVVLN